MPSLLSPPAPISCSVRVRAAPHAVFDLLSDPRRHPEIDGSGTLRGNLAGPDRLMLGSTFGMSMRYWGLPYRITNTVTEYEQDRLIAWTHVTRVVWRYELRAVPEGTEITETWDPTPSPLRLLYRWAGFPQRSVTAILATLQRIKAAVEPPSNRRPRPHDHGGRSAGQSRSGRPLPTGGTFPAVSGRDLLGCTRLGSPGIFG